MTDTGERPVLLAIDGDREALARITAELERRYGDDYRVACRDSAAAALAELEALDRRGERAAIVLVADRVGDQAGSELLSRVRTIQPDAKRALLIEWGAWSDPETAEEVLGAMALGHIDYYAIKPWREPDEQFHRLISEFLYEWCRANSTQSREISLVAEPWTARGHELRSLLTRSGVPYAFHPPDSAEARRILAEVGAEAPASGAPPVIVMASGKTIVDPSNAELVEAFGVQTELEGESDFDLVIVGAGPAGLAAAVYASSEGLHTLVIERETVGGQAGSTSLIRNYLGFSRGISGGDLAQRAYQQAWVFGTRFLLTREAVGLRTEGDRHVLSVGEVGEVSAPAVVLATGVSYRRLGIEALEELTGAGVFYGAALSEARALAGQHAVVVGGGNSAGQAAVHLARWASRVSLVVRSPSLGVGMSQYLRDEIDAAAPIDVRLNSEVVDASGTGRLERVAIRDNASGGISEEEASAVFILIGARPRTGWLPETVARDPRGYLITGSALSRDPQLASAWPLERPPMMLETSLPGVFAVGDAREGAVKRVASAVGQGSVVIQQVHDLLGERSIAARERPIAAEVRQEEATWL